MAYDQWFIYPEGMTKDFEGFLAIPLFITLLDSALTSPNFDLRYVAI